MKMLDRQTGISDVESRIITIIRTCAMFFIILCHYLAFFDGLEALSQLFNVGVPVFFIISGFLYGQKRIANIGRWYRKQFLKIIIPLYTYYLISGIVLWIIGKLGEIRFIDVIKLLLNLQGICGGKIGNIQTAHLWFITFILICYLITPLLQLLKSKSSFIILTLCIVATSFIWIVIILNIKCFYFISWVPGILSYVFAYFLASFWKRDCRNPIAWICSILLMAISVFIRLVFKCVADNGSIFVNNVYDNVFVPFSQCLLAFGFFFTVYIICANCVRLTSCLSKAFKVFDSYSYYVYIVHYMFIEGVVAVTLFTDNLVIITALFVAGTVLCAIVLKWVSSLLLYSINRRI